MSLLDALLLYRNSGIYPFHMPGHKRNAYFYADYSLDITEIDGFDNLHDAKGILKTGMDKAAGLYKSDKTFFLVNGSTCGILAAVTACTKRGDSVLVARNCHKSVYNALFLNDLKPVYILPPVCPEFSVCASVTPESVEKALNENPDIKLVIITSPTYEGVVSDIKTISQIVHKKGIPLLVDEAHGAHFGFSEEFPSNSVSCGADIVVHSLHKTLPAPTQTALLHVNGTLADPDRVRDCLGIFETSSPSYILMSATENCIDVLLKEKEKLFYDYIKLLDDFYKKAKYLKNIKIMEKDSSPLFFDFDKGKIIVSVKNTSLTGTQLKNILLDRYLSQLEMAAGDYAVAMTSICDTEDGFLRLFDALEEIDSYVSAVLNEEQNINIYKIPQRKVGMTEAAQRESSFVRFNDSAGKISKEFVYAYPPGIPVLCPGEIIDEEVIQSIIRSCSQGIDIKSSYGRVPQEISVLI